MSGRMHAKSLMSATWEGEGVWIFSHRLFRFSLSGLFKLYSGEFQTYPKAEKIEWRTPCIECPAPTTNCTVVLLHPHYLRPLIFPTINNTSLVISKGSRTVDRQLALEQALGQECFRSGEVRKPSDKAMWLSSSSVLLPGSFTLYIPFFFFYPLDTSLKWKHLIIKTQYLKRVFAVCQALKPLYVR